MANGDIVNTVAEHGKTLQQTKAPYSTAVSVQVQRDLQVVRSRLKDEAAIGGEMMYYGWGAGKDHIEGPSIHLAMAAARCWGNCAVFPEPVQDGGDAWIFTSAFVDLETGFTLSRQFRQSKTSIVYGKHDEERKTDIRFQIGQSKASRNVVVNALPKSIINEAMAIAKAGVRIRLEKWIHDKGETGMAQAQDGALAALLHHGIDEERILSKMSRPTRGALTLDDLIVLKGDIVAIQDGNERAEELFPPLDAETGGDDVMEHLGGDDDPEPDPPAPKPKGSKKKGSKSKSETEKIDPPNNPPPEEGKEATGQATGSQDDPQAEPSPPVYIWGDEDPVEYIKDVSAGMEGNMVGEAVQEIKARYNRLMDDPEAISKFEPDWDAIKGDAGEKGAEVVMDIRAWYIAIGVAEGKIEPEADPE